MARARDTSFFCKECGYESPKWAGQCPACKTWNSFVEAPVSSGKTGMRPAGISQDGTKRVLKAWTINEIEAGQGERYVTGIGEFDRVLGGGIIKDSLVLVGGDPGIGKSTLLMQVCKELSSRRIRVLYVSGEESLSQIRLRADRLGEFTGYMKLLCETDLDRIEGVLTSEQPQVLVIDSIQTMYRQDVGPAPGSAAQVRESTNLLLQWAKGMGIAIFLVGHVTKEGVVAGPRMLEHMVDTVLYFEGDAHTAYRILRGVKNRFGSTNEIGVFEMYASGLRQVSDPSSLMLTGRPLQASGSVVSCSLEGTRPILTEIQALAARSALSNPRRSATGFDYNRLNLLIAVLEKRLGFQMAQCDIYVNVAGGMRISETALDLAVITALASAFLDFIVPADVMVIGEVGLSGEVRSVSQLESRVREAAKMGLSRCVVPSFGLNSLKEMEDVRLYGVTSVSQAIELLRKM